MRPSTPKLKFSDKEFLADSRENMLNGTATDKNKAAAFVMLFGTHAWAKLKHQFAEQRVPKEPPIAPEKLKNLSDAEYEKIRDEMKNSQKLPKKDEPVYAEVNAPDLQLLGLEGQRAFLDAFGAERYFKALDVNVDLSAKAYHEAVGREYKPYGEIKQETKEARKRRTA